MYRNSEGYVDPIMPLSITAKSILQNLNLSYSNNDLILIYTKTCIIKAALSWSRILFICD